MARIKEVALLDRYGPRATVKSVIFTEALKLLRYLFESDETILATKEPPGKWNVVFWMRYGWASFDRQQEVVRFENIVRQLLKEVDDEG